MNTSVRHRCWLHIALLLSMLSGGCRSFSPRDVAGWRQIQEVCAAAEVDGVTDAEIAQIVHLCVSDARLCEEEPPRFGRLQFALLQAMFVTDLDMAKGLWATVVPDVTAMALNDEERATIVLGYLSRACAGGTEDLSRRLDILDGHMGAFLASDDEVIRSWCRVRRAQARVESMRYLDSAERDARRQEITSLVAAAKQDGLLDQGGDLEPLMLGFGLVGDHGFPEVGGNAWMPPTDDPCWWRPPTTRGDATWSVVFFTSTDCGFCGPYWKDLLQAVRDCEPGRAPRTIAVVTSEEIPEYLEQAEDCAVYHSRQARAYLSCGWGVTAIPTAFILDRDGRFSRVFLGREEIAQAIEEACAAQP